MQAVRCGLYPRTRLGPRDVRVVLDEPVGRETYGAGRGSTGSRAGTGLDAEQRDAANAGRRALYVEGGRVRERVSERGLRGAFGCCGYDGAGAHLRGRDGL